MTLMLMTPSEVAKRISEAAKEKRLFLDFSQQGLSVRSGVSLGVIKKFERTGKISLESLLKLALILGGLDDFLKVFEPVIPVKFPSLELLLKQKNRKRGRKY